MTCTVKMPPKFGFPSGYTVTVTGSGEYITAFLYRLYMYGTVIQ